VRLGAAGVGVLGTTATACLRTPSCPLPPAGSFGALCRNSGMKSCGATVEVGAWVGALEQRSLEHQLLPYHSPS
jgi:hypothetical protein